MPPPRLDGLASAFSDRRMRTLISAFRAALRGDPGAQARFAALCPPRLHDVASCAQLADHLPAGAVTELLAAATAAQAALVGRLRGQRPRAPGARADGLLTEAQLCVALHVSRKAALRMRRDLVDPIPCMKAGRRYLYDLERVQAWMERRAGRAAVRGRRRGRLAPRAVQAAPRRPTS